MAADVPVEPITDERPAVPDDVEQIARQLAVRLDAGGSRGALELLEASLGLLADHPDALDLKIAAAAMTEMREAFEVFGPYEDVPKVTVFGSARTRQDDPVYDQARQIAAALAERGWMVVTGAGPGIMQAAMEGAGRDRSIGVAIRLPFEQGANPVIAGDEKYVSMKYFFTRKLMLVKESRAFVCLPGGFGTLDETFELLTLTQTGKGLPVPIVLLDPPGDPFWKRIDDVDPRPARGPWAGRPRPTPGCTSSPTRSRRRARRSTASTPTTTRSATSATRSSSACATRRPTSCSPSWTSASADLLARGRFVRSEPLDIERRHDDHVDLPRLRFSFAKHQANGLRDADRHPEPRCRPDRRRRQRPRPRRRGADAGSGVVAARRRRWAAFSTARRAWVQRLVLGGRAVAPSADRLLQQVERQLVELGADGLEPVGQVVESRLTAAAPRRRCRRDGATSTPAAARCIAQPGLALATTVAPLRCVARRMAASLRSRISPASVGLRAPSRRRRRHSTGRRRRARRRRSRGAAPCAPARAPAGRGGGGTGPGR